MATGSAAPLGPAGGDAPLLSPAGARALPAREVAGVPSGPPLATAVALPWPAAFDMPRAVPAGPSRDPAVPVRPVAAGMAWPLPVLVSDVDAFRRVLAETEAAPEVGVDTETTGLDPHLDRLRTVQIAVAGRVWVVDAAAVGDLRPLRRWLAARAAAPRRTYLHNAKFDLKMMRAALGGAPVHPVAVRDLYLWSLVQACGLPAPGGHGLAALAARWLAVDLPKDERLGDWGRRGPLSPAQIAYAARDALVLLPLARALEDGGAAGRGLRAEGLLAAAAIEDECVSAVADMEYAGIGFDADYWAGLADRLRRGLAGSGAEALRLLERATPGAARRPVPVSLLPFPGGPDDAPAGAEGSPPGPAPSGLNLNSPSQLLAALHAAGVPATSTAVRALRLHAADHPAVGALLVYKRQAKLLSAFGDTLPSFVHPRTGRIHAHYQQLHGGGLGRFACGGPNVQQIPREPAFRRGFVAGPGRRLVIADLNQIELRVMARLSGDERMQAAFARGEDLHRVTAALLTGTPAADVTAEQRQMAKAANFGLIYAMSAAGLRGYAAASYGVHLSASEAERFHRRFFEGYAGVAAYHRRQGAEARPAREVRTLSGRCHRWADDRIGLPVLVNFPAQGTAADILKRSMALLRPVLIRAGADLVASVHDELLVDCPEDAAPEVCAAVRGALVRAGSEWLAPVPVEADAKVGASWADK